MLRQLALSVNMSDIWLLLQEFGWTHKPSCSHWHKYQTEEMDKRKQVGLIRRYTPGL